RGRARRRRPRRRAPRRARRRPSRGRARRPLPRARRSGRRSRRVRADRGAPPGREPRSRPPRDHGAAGTDRVRFGPRVAVRGAPPGPEKPPRTKHQDPPIYPDVPPEQRKPTDVTVHLEIDATGTATTGKVTSQPSPAFDDVAVTTALGWLFEPATRGGQPIPG